MGGAQVATVGRIELVPNLINVIPREARLTVDLRNTDDRLLHEAEQSLAEFVRQLAADEGIEVESERLARFAPVRFDEGIVSLIEKGAATLGHGIRRMTSGAGHDAQMMARICPTAMIFVPSVNGISHNPREHTDPEHLRLGADLLMRTLLELAG
jgi:N-carbamoyl-L-amino-acid hydrolase